MADSYPRISRDGIRLWLEQPETKAFLQCLAWYREQLEDVRKAAGFVADTHDKTTENLYRNLGADQCAGDFERAESLLEMYGLIEEGDDAEG